MTNHIRPDDRRSRGTQTFTVAGPTPSVTRLIAQWRRCGGDRCRVRNCKRCRRGAEYARQAGVAS